MWDTPPVEKRKITCLARPGKWERFGASGSWRASSASSGCKRPGRSREPPASDCRKPRREHLSDIDELVQTEHDAGKALPGLVLAEARASFRHIVQGGGAFVRRRGAPEREREGPLHAVRIVRALLPQPRGEGLRLLMDEGVVEQVERLQRRRARDPERSAHVRLGAVEDP